MSKKRAIYSAEFKTKVVLEVLKEQETLGEIATKYKVLPKNIPCACTLFEKTGKNSS